MAADQGVTDTIVLSDFTSGITSDFHSTYVVATPQASQQDGFAQKTRTWGCYGPPGGGLVPLPKAVERRTEDDLTVFSADFDDMTLKCMHLAGVYLVSPVRAAIDDFSVPYTEDLPPDQIFAIYQWFEDGASPGDYVLKQILWQSSEFASGFTSTLHAETYPDTTYDLSQLKFAYGDLDLTTNNDTDPLEKGTPYLIASFADHNATSWTGSTKSFPDFNGARDVDGVGGIASFGGMKMICHQGRVVWLSLASWSTALDGKFNGEGFGTLGALPIDEALQFTAVNDFTEVTAGALAIIPENQSGYGTFASINASELLAIKQRGGGAVIKGSLDRPTVVRLPGLPSTLGASNKGVNTEKGFVYGTRTGVWLYAGGDGADLLSPQLEGWFWEPEGPYALTRTRDGAPLGQFAYVHPFLYAPNGWVMDFRTGGWFRLFPGVAEEEGIVNAGGTPVTRWARAMHFVSSVSGQVYGFESTVVPTDEDSEIVDSLLLWTKFDSEKAADEYYWTSQPLARSRNRFLDFRQVTILAEGSGSIDITLTGAEVNPVTVSFDGFDSSKPTAYTLPVKMRAHDVIVEIHATASSPSASSPGAPRLYRLSLGFREAQTVANPV